MLKVKIKVFRRAGGYLKRARHGSGVQALSQLFQNVPELDEGTVTAVNWIRTRQRNSGNTFISGRPLARIAAQQVGFLADRVASNDVEVRATAQILMPDACGNNDDIARLHMSADSRRVSKTDRCLPAIDAQHLVSGAMIVSKGIDAVAPCGFPNILRIESFKMVGQLLSPRGGDYTFVDQQGKAWVVWYTACIGEEMLLGLTHGNSFLLRVPVLQSSGDRWTMRASTSMDAKSL